MPKKSEANLRITALESAIRSTREDANSATLVERATAFYNFLKGE